MENLTVVSNLGNFMFNAPGRYAQYQAPPYSCIARLVLVNDQPSPRRFLELFPIITDNRRTAYQGRFVTASEFDDFCKILQERCGEIWADFLHQRGGVDASGRHFLELPIDLDGRHRHPKTLSDDNGSRLPKN